MVGAAWRFGVFGFWCRALARLLLDLECVRNVHQSSDLHGPLVYDGMITAGICHPWNRVQGSSCTAAIFHFGCRLRVIRYRSVGAENRSMSAVPRKRRKVRALASVAWWHGRREPL